MTSTPHRRPPRPRSPAPPLRCPPEAQRAGGPCNGARRVRATTSGRPAGRTANRASTARREGARLPPQDGRTPLPGRGRTARPQGRARRRAPARYRRPDDIRLHVTGGAPGSPEPVVLESPPGTSGLPAYSCVLLDVLTGASVLSLGDEAEHRVEGGHAGARRLERGPCARDEYGGLGWTAGASPQSTQSA